MRRLLVSLALLAAAGLSEGSDRRESSSRADAGCTGLPTLPETFVAPNASPPAPLLDGDLAASADRPELRVVDVAAASKVDRRLFLIEAQVFEKYLAFRDSLRTP